PKSPTATGYVQPAHPPINPAVCRLDGQEQQEGTFGARLRPGAWRRKVPKAWEKDFTLFWLAVFGSWLARGAANPCKATRRPDGILHVSYYCGKHISFGAGSSWRGSHWPHTCAC